MRRKTWWIKFQHPATGEILRESLATHDAARAELLQERLEREIALLDPRVQAVEVPEAVRRLVPAQASVALAVRPIIRPAMQPTAARVPFDEAITAYLAFIRTENAPVTSKTKFPCSGDSSGANVLRTFPSRRIPAYRTGPAVQDRLTRHSSRYLHG